MEDNQAENTTSEMKSKSVNPALIVLIVLVVAIVAFVAMKPKTGEVLEATPTGVPTQTNQQPTLETTNTNVKEFTLEGGSFYFKPNVINVKKGDKVKVTLNSVSMMHDFVIDELNVKSERVASGSSTSVEFVADKVGSFEFYCSVGQHRANGMVGTINITE